MKSIEDLMVGQPDRAGNEIICMFIKAPPSYAVYSTPLRVMIQFADDKIVADQQRGDVRALNDLRSKIDGLIARWRSNPAYRKRAARYNARVGAAIALCLEGDPANSYLALTDIHEDILAELGSWGRMEYLLSASVVAFAAIWFCFAITHSGLGLIELLIPQQTNLWLGAKAGAVGAFFSIVLGIRGRTILTTLNRMDNYVDAMLRVAIGAISGGVMMLLLSSSLIPAAFQVMGTTTMPRSTNASWEALLVIGFIAGFIERLVPDLLSKSQASQNQAQETTPPRVPPPPAQQRQQAGGQADPEITAIGVVIGGAPTTPIDVGANVVRLVVDGENLSNAANFVLTFADVTLGATQAGVINLSAKDTPSAFLIKTKSTDQQGTADLFRKLVLDITSATAHPPAWANPPVVPGTRKLTIINPSGRRETWPF